MQSLVHRLAAALLTLVALAVPAPASGPHHRPWSFASVRLVDLPTGGTLIRIHGTGCGRTVLQSREAIAVAAVRDVDADGDLDIIASNETGLLHRISRVISRHGCNVDLVLISTEGAKAIDVFHITAGGAKLSDAAQAGLTADLQRMLEGHDEAD